MKIPFRLFYIAYSVAFAFNANLSYGQIKFGPIVGLNFSELPNNTKFIISKQQIYSGYHLGAVAEIRVFKQLFLQPGVLLSNKGSKYIVGNNSGGSGNGFSNFQFSTLNADIPLNLICKFDVRSVRLLLIAGYQLGYGLAGKWEAIYTTSSKLHFGNDPESDLRPLDYGVNFGGGFEAGRIQFSAQYYLGLRTLSTLTPPLKEQKYKILTISVACLFGKDKSEYKDYKSRYLHKYRQIKAHRKKHR